MDKEYFSSLIESWELLRRTDLPVCIYGMGDACERLLEQFELRGIECRGIFASDDFVRGQKFCGFDVCTLSQLEERFGDIIVCCAFGSALPDVMSHVADISKRHTLVYPDLPIAGDVFFNKADFLDRFDDARLVYDLLEDEQSRRTFSALFSFKISGDISHLAPIFCDTDKAFSELVAPQSGEVYADLGAYNGDTAEKFISCCEEYERLYLFEPDKRSFRKCVKNLIGRDNITFVNACAWSEDTRLSFSQSAGRQSQIAFSGADIAARSLDSVLNGNRCTIIKYDVEGAEHEAIAGSQKTIRQYSPRLIVSAYHRPFDLIDIPKQILELDPSYMIYLRQPPYFPAWDSLIFAVK